jgi:hypothetical protein
MIYLISCLDKIKVGWTAQSFETYLKWLQRRVPWYLQVLAIREGTEDEEKDFHREHKDFHCDYGGREWYGLDMLPTAKEFVRLPEAPRGSEFV